MTALGPRSSLPPAITSDVFRVFRDDGSIDEQHDPGLSNDELTFLYKHMVQTRRIDERFISLQRQGRIAFHVGSLGEEAAIIGSAFAMRPSDSDLSVLPRVWRGTDARFPATASGGQCLWQCG